MISFPSIFSHRLHFGLSQNYQTYYRSPHKLLALVFPLCPPPPRWPRGYLFSRLPRWFSAKNPPENDGNPPQYSCLGNPKHRDAWRVTVHGVRKRRTQLKQLKHLHKSYYNLPFVPQQSPTHATLKQNTAVLNISSDCDH